MPKNPGVNSKSGGKVLYVDGDMQVQVTPAYLGGALFVQYLPHMNILATWSRIVNET